MRIAVIGSGAIGNLVGGYLKQKGKDVCLVGNPASVEVISKQGLTISGARGDFKIFVDIFEKLPYSCELAIIATKTQDLEVALRNNYEFIKKAVILTTQNGIQADNIAAKIFPTEAIVSSIVMFGSTYLEPGKVVHNFEGDWILGNMFGNDNSQVHKAEAELEGVFKTVVSPDIKGMKCLKIFVNANNCIAAVLGKSMQEAFSDPEISRISIGIWREGYLIVKRSGVKLASLPDFPIERVVKFVSMPEMEAAKIYSGIMVNLSKEPLYGSILQSIKRGKPSEIDYINGEFVNLAKQNGLRAPLNAELIKMVHEVENSGRFFTKEELISRTKGLLN